MRAKILKKYLNKEVTLILEEDGKFVLRCIIKEVNDGSVVVKHSSKRQTQVINSNNIIRIEVNE